MKRLLPGLVLLLLCVATPAFAGDDDETALDVKQLVGSWSFVSGKRAGEDVDKERLVGTVKVSEDDFTLPAGPDEVFVMAYEVDTDKSPAAIVLEIKSGPVPSGRAVGIIKIDDGKMVLCYDPMGANRPEKFESTEENGAFLFILEKADD